MFGIDEILLLHLSRSAPSFLSPDSEKTNREDLSQFSMFDYFDWLTVERSNRLDHLSCLGLEPVRAENVPQTSSQNLVLAMLQTQKKLSVQQPGWKIGDPFFCADGMDFPFLSVMMVNVLPNCNENVSISGKKDVGKFLLACITQLQELVDRTCQQFFVQDGGSALQAVYQVYHCVNSSNFCIVVRSRVPELSCHISMLVRAEQLNTKAEHGFPPLDCDTFSFAGIYCPVNQSYDAWQPPERVQKASLSRIALRLSVTNHVHNELSRKNHEEVIENVYGLYGRYDVTLHISLKMFWRLYPWVCAHKLGIKAPKASQEDDSLISLLKQALENQQAQCINARLLLNLMGGEAPSDTGERQRKRQERVRRENREVSDQLRKIERLSDRLPSCQMEYLACMYQLQDLWESYKSLRYQDDSFINGNILLAQIRLLSEIIRCYIKSIDGMEAPKIFYQDLVKNLKEAVNSISHFQKLILSVNQQSLQSPHYEVQMHADMEKFIVAYTEFCRRFLTEHLKPEPDEDRGLEFQQQKIFPILIVEIIRNGIQATPLFLLPYHRVENERLVKTNPSKECLLLSIQMPSINAFGSIYTTLPPICHELFHNFRVMKRGERNEVLGKFLLYRVAQYVVRRWIAQAGERSNYSFLGALEKGLFVDKLADQLYNAYYRRCESAHQTANIGVLLSNIMRFLTDDVFTARNEDEFQRPMESPEQISDILGKLCRMALDASETETPAWADTYEELYFILKKGKDLDNLDHELAPLVRDLVHTVLAGHTTRVMEISMELCDLVKQMPELKFEILKSVKDICDTVTAHFEVFLLAARPDATERCIEQINDARAKIIKDSTLPKSCALLIKSLDLEICELCHAIKDVNHLISLLGSCQCQRNKIHLENRDQLLREYHDAVWEQISKYNNDSIDGLIFSSPQMQELLAPLGGAIQHDEPFVSELRQVLFHCSYKDIENTINSSATLYREVFADLGMCISLKLSVFGYLRVLARSGIFEDLDEKPASMKLERMLLVSWILLKPKNIEAVMQPLWKEVSSFF